MNTFLLNLVLGFILSQLAKLSDKTNWTQVKADLDASASKFAAAEAEVARRDTRIRDLVARDVANGYITVDEARDVYKHPVATTPAE